MRTAVYIDGFNLYYRALKSRPNLKWLDVRQLAANVLDPSNNITSIKYYTAHVSARVDPSAPRRQKIYLDALSTIPNLKIVYGNFLVNKVYARMVAPPSNGKPLFHPWPNVVRVYKTEEKGSDVNIGSHLVRDAFMNEFDVAAVITNDTDLVEPIRIVTQEVGKVVGILSPVNSPAHGLRQVATFLRHIRHAHLVNAQFPDPIPRAGAPDLVKPATWVAPGP